VSQPSSAVFGGARQAPWSDPCPTFAALNISKSSTRLLLYLPRSPSSLTAWPTPARFAPSSILGGGAKNSCWGASPAPAPLWRYAILRIDLKIQSHSTSYVRAVCKRISSSYVISGSRCLHYDAYMLYRDIGTRMSHWQAHLT